MRSTLFTCVSATALALLSIADTAYAGIRYLPDTYVDKTGRPTWHGITVNGNPNGYSITTQSYKGVESRAQCKATVNNSAGLGEDNQPLFTAPCQTTTRIHGQRIHVQCIDPNTPNNEVTASATITFRHRPNDDGRVIVETNGTFFYGFSNEPTRTQLHSDARGVSNSGQHIDVILSCYNARRFDRTYP